MAHKWRFMINQFMVATRNNYKKANKLSTEHDMRLHAAMNNEPGDTDYSMLYNRYHPLHVELTGAYVKWMSEMGAQKSESHSVKELFRILPKKINKVDIMIQNLYEKGSPRYIELFPKAHKPFYRNSHIKRIDSLEALSNTIGDEIALADAKVMVDNLVIELKTASNGQAGAKNTTKRNSVQMENARKNAMNGQYQNLGFLINKFPTEAARIKAYFDVSTLTQPEQCIWRGQLPAGKVHHTLTRTFEPGDMIRIKNSGNADIEAYLSNTQEGTNSSPVIIWANQQMIFDVSQFNVKNISEHRFLTLINKDPAADTRFLVQLY
jgi:hypothetical protein